MKNGKIDLKAELEVYRDGNKLTSLIETAFLNLILSYVLIKTPPL